MSDTPKRDPSLDLVDACRDKMLEHFDSVQIFVTRHSGGNDSTRSYNVGGGNFFAQLGQITEWMEMQKQRARTRIIEEDQSAD